MIVPMIMRTPVRFMAVSALAMQLAACGGGAGDGDERTASGEVLEGSISDEMLPLDQVTSQPPPLKIEPASKPTESTEDAEEGEEDSEAPGDAPPVAAEPGSAE